MNAVRLWKRQRSQKDGMNDAEDSGIGTDAERKRCDCGNGEAFFLPEELGGELQVSDQFFHGLTRVVSGITANHFILLRKYS